MSKKYVNVRVTYISEFHEIEIDDEEIEFAKRVGIDVEDDEELVKFHLENNFSEHVDLLYIDDFEAELEENEYESDN